MLRNDDRLDRASIKAGVSHFPKDTDLSRHSVEDLAAVAAAHNNRPRKTLGWKMPAEALDEHLRLAQEAAVATTP